LEILLLQERGNLSLDDSAVKYIPSLNISKEITLEMLASQMSGLGRDRMVNPLPPNLDLSQYVPGTCGRKGFTCTPDEFNRILGEHPPVFQPETQPSCTPPVHAHPYCFGYSSLLPFWGGGVDGRFE
jgi:hypothetical protein